MAQNFCEEKQSLKDEESMPEVQFFPPLYTQRYMLAVKHLMIHHVKKVIDFGCAECGFLNLLTTVPSLEQIDLVDIDRTLLVSKQRVINPELRHFVHPRSVALNVSLFCGSAADFDPRCADTDAVTLIEVIEHLEPEVLLKVTSNVFKDIHPRLCIVTTPNVEFNILFGNSDPNQLRHWDHKFEWTRAEFQSWCNGVCKNFNYSVEYSGVGSLPSSPKSFHLGPCSQAAIFTAMPSRVPDCRDGGEDTDCCYELIAESHFPYIKDELTYEEKVDLEVLYGLRTLLFAARSRVTPGEPLLLDISVIANFRPVQRLCEIDEVRRCLHRNSYKLSPDGRHVVIHEADLSASSEDGISDESDNNNNDNEDDRKADDIHSSDIKKQDQIGGPLKTNLLLPGETALSRDRSGDSMSADSAIQMYLSQQRIDTAGVESEEDWDLEL